MYDETGSDLYLVSVKLILRIFFKVLKFNHKINNVK